jgi:hypothetical protein
MSVLMGSEIATISWRMLTGNKFRRDLLPEMFTDAGCLKRQSIRQVGDFAKSVFDVFYDTDYGLEFLMRKVCRPLSPLGREKVHELIDKAWDIYERKTTVM